MTTFTATGSNQTYTVPTTTNRVLITCIGGAGGRQDTYQAGGNGHGATGAVVTVTPGATLTVQVGRSGNNGGWPDAGTSPNGPSPGYPTINGAPGGGSSRVWLGSVGATLLIVGGGGGGVGTGGSNRGKGGNAGFVAQSGFSPFQTNNAAGYGGGGGTQSAGGAAGAVPNAHVVAPQAGSSLHGGNGGVYGLLFSVYYSGGGGGGGYFGGGGGSVRADGYSGGGGGGSSWCPWTYAGTATAWNGGASSSPSDGYVTIDPLPPAFRGGLIIGQPIGVDGLYVS